MINNRQQAACILIYYTLFITVMLIENAYAIKIRPESCTNALGEKGTCMFVWQCIKQDGHQLGPCVDRFLVGTCCALPKEEDNMVPGASLVSPAVSWNKNASTTKPTHVPTKIKPVIVTLHPTSAVTRWPDNNPASHPLTSGTSPITLPVFRPTPESNLIPQATGPKFPRPTFRPFTMGTTTKKPTADFSECGLQSHIARGHRVVGGTHSQFGEWPWQVSVRRSSFFGFASTHRCGGAILSASWIATAAHCVDDLLKNQIRIRVGEFDFSTVQEPAPFQERGIEKKVVHPRYNFFTYEHDLALLKLESPVILQEHIKPICLPQEDATFVGLNATVTGWGRLSEGGTLPSKLQQVQVPVVSNDKCQKMFKAAGRHENIPEIFLCAGYETGGRDSCQGDSGGPLQAQRADGRWFLAGIISWGIGCAEPNMPGVCTRISKFTDWIHQTIG